MNELISFEDTAVAFGHKSARELRKTRMIYNLMNYPFLVKHGSKFIEKAIHLGLTKRIVKQTLFYQFCGGETLEDSKRAADKLMENGIYTFLTFSSEGNYDEQSFERATLETLRTIEFAAENKAIPFAVIKLTAIVKTELLEKVQSRADLSREEQAAFDRFVERVDRVCKRTYELGVRFLIDAEETWIQTAIDDIADDMMEKYNRERPLIYNTYQMYRRAGFDTLEKAFNRAEERNYHLGIKLVRGAYMEKEGNRAQKLGYENPINPTKEATDAMYHEALEFILSRIRKIGFFAGTHNEKSCAFIAQLMRDHEIPTDHPNVFTGQIFGMSDNITFNMSKSGYNAIKYVPYGPVQEVMPYLIRRAQENTAIAGQSNREYKLVMKEIQRRRSTE